MSSNADRILERRLARLDPSSVRTNGRRAQRTKVVTAGASATAVLGLTMLYSARSGAPVVDPVVASVDSGAATATSAASGELVVMIDASGNLLSYPPGVEPAVVNAAVASELVRQGATATTLEPVAAPEVVRLAVPASGVDPTDAGDLATENDVSSVEATTVTSTATSTAAPSSTSTTTVTTTAAANPSRHAPQSKSSGS